MYICLMIVICQIIIKLGYITFAVGIAPVLLRNGVIPIGGVVNRVRIVSYGLIRNNIKRKGCGKSDDMDF